MCLRQGRAHKCSKEEASWVLCRASLCFGGFGKEKAFFQTIQPLSWLFPGLCWGPSHSQSLSWIFWGLEPFPNTTRFPNFPGLGTHLVKGIPPCCLLPPAVYPGEGCWSPPGVVAKLLPDQLTRQDVSLHLVKPCRLIPGATQS